MSENTETTPKLFGNIDGMIFSSNLVPIDYILKQSSEFLGTGGFGRVVTAEVIAECEYKGELVALKAIRCDPRFTIKYANREVLSLKRVRNHPSIVKFICAVLSYNRSPNTEDYIVMELCGESALRKEMSVTDVYKFSLSVSYALMSIHSLNLVHRDIKPGNVVIDKDNMMWKVCDFGLAVDADLAITDVGTNRYKAPELLRNEVLTTEQLKLCDVYAMGVSIKELLDYVCCTPAERSCLLNVAEMCSCAVGSARCTAEEAYLSLLKLSSQFKDVDEYIGVLDRHRRCSYNDEPDLTVEHYSRLNKLRDSVRGKLSAIKSERAMFIPSRDRGFGIIGSMRAGEPWRHERTVTVELSSNDLYNILSAKSSDRFRMTQANPMIEIRLQESITPKSVEVRFHKEAPRFRVAVVRPDGTEVDIITEEAKGENSLYEVTKLVKATGSIFRLYTNSRKAYLRSIDFHTEVHTRGYFMAKSSIDPRSMPVTLMADQYDTNSFFALNSRKIVATRRMDNNWMKVSFEKTVAVSRYTFASAVSGEISWILCVGEHAREVDAQRMQLKAGQIVEKEVKCEPSRVFWLKMRKDFRIFHFEVYGQILPE